jgi:hypothetical protein
MILKEDLGALDLAEFEHTLFMRLFCLIKVRAILK